MSTTLYLECSSGISGDMTVAALLDLGASERHLREALATLPVANEFSVAVSHVHKNGIAAVDFDVELDAAHETHDHDMAWLYGTGDAAPAMHEHEHAEHGHERMAGPTAHHDHEHDHEHEHEHDHCGHGQEHVGHHHAHRSLADVTAIIDGSGLSARAKELAHAVFRKLAEAEAAAHGATPETVHFHEGGPPTPSSTSARSPSASMTLTSRASSCPRSPRATAPSAAPMASCRCRCRP